MLSYSTQDANGQLLLNMLAVFASYESQAGSERTSSIIRQANIDCHYRPAPPWGMLKVAGKYTWRSEDCKALIRAVYMHAQQHESEWEIAKEPDLQQLALHPDKTAGLSRDTVRGILAQPIYGGRISVLPRNRHNGQRIPIAQQETYPAPFVNANDQLFGWQEWMDFQSNRQRNTHGGTRSAEILLGKLLYCTKDRRFLTAQANQSHTRDKVRYICLSDKKGGACGKSVWQHHIEPEMSRVLLEVLQRTDLSTPEQTPHKRLLEQDVRRAKAQIATARNNLLFRENANDWEMRKMLDSKVDLLNALEQRQQDMATDRKNVGLLKEKLTE